MILHHVRILDFSPVMIRLKDKQFVTPHRLTFPEADFYLSDLDPKGFENL
jgi:hypothetical protein